MVYHLKNLPIPTTANELLDIIEQQTHHLPPSEDAISSAASNVTGKQAGTPMSGKA